MEKNGLIFVVFLFIFVMTQGIYAAELTELQKKARALLKNNRSTIQNVAIDQLKNRVPALKQGNYSGLLNAASSYLGNNTSIANTLTHSLQDAQSIYSNSMNLMSIMERINAGGGDINAITTTDLQQILSASQNIYNSSQRIMNLVKANTELYKTLTGAYNQLTGGSGDWNSKVELLMKVLPYLKK